MKKKRENKNKKRARLHARKRRSGTNLPKIVKYKSPKTVKGLVPGVISKVD